jgi:ankyrin repeat protein
MTDKLIDMYYTAVKNGKVDEAKEVIDELLAKGVRLDNRHPKRGQTYLTYAIRYHQPEIVNYLLDKGANTNVQDKLHTPLFMAILQGDKPIVKLLLDRGADPNLSSPMDSLPLKPIHMAIGRGQMEILQLLVEGGANVNDNVFHLPLSLAIEERKPEIFDYLLSVGANVNAQGVRYLTTSERQFPPLIAAIHFKDTRSTLKLIDAGANVNALFDGWSALQYAVQSGTYDMVKALCEHGANVNYKYPQKNFTALILAVIRKPISLDIIKILCEYGADKNVKTYQNQTAYSYAQTINDDAIMNEVMNSLLYCGVTDPKAVNKAYLNQATNNNPGKVEIDMEELNQRLYHAIEEGDLKRVKEAIAYGADVGDNQYDPLVKAAFYGNIELFKYLLSIADLPLDKGDSDKDFITKLLVVARDNLEMFKFIEKKSGQNVKSVLFDVLQVDIIKRYNRVLAYIVSNYPQIGNQTFLKTLLSLSVQYGNEEAFQMLMKLKGLKINELGNLVKGFARSGNLRMLQYFQEKGFDFNPIADDLWKIVYHRWVEIEKFLEDLGFPKPEYLLAKVNTNNTPYGGKRRTRKSRATRRKSDSRSQKY